MEFRKMVTITLYTRQQKRQRCIEQSFGLCGRERGWDDLGEWHWNMYNTMCETSRQSGFGKKKKHWSFNFSISPSKNTQIQHHNFKTSILRHSAFFVVQLSHLSMTTGKTIALMIRNFVSKVMFLLFNTLSRFGISFLPRSKCLLIPWRRTSQE